MVFVMTVNHLGLKPYWLRTLTGSNSLWVSAAEGFVLISGVVFGLIYHKRIQTKGWDWSIRKILKRAFQLYLIAVIWQLVFGTLTILQRAYLGRFTSLPENYFQFILNAVFTIRDMVLGIDLLPMYAILLVWGLFVLYFLARKEWYWAAILSLFFWYMRQLDPDALGVFRLNFNPGSWQILFTAGILIGYYREGLQNLRKRLPVPSWILSAVVISSTFILLALSYRISFHNLWQDASWLYPNSNLFEKYSLAPGRVLVSIWVFWGFYELTTIAWRPLNRLFGWLLTFLGQHALAAYVIQSSIAYLVISIPGHPFTGIIPKFWLPVVQIAIFILAGAITYGVVQIDQRMAARRQARYASADSTTGG